MSPFHILYMGVLDLNFSHACHLCTHRIPTPTAFSRTGGKFCGECRLRGSI